MGDLITPQMAELMHSSLARLDLGAISLTADEALRRKLRNKHGEYEVRLTLPYRDVLDTVCKAGVVGALLSDRMVTPVTALQHVADKYAAYVQREFQRLLEEGFSPEHCFTLLQGSLKLAWKVVADYNATGGENVHGGTGLKLADVPSARPLPNNRS